MDIFELVNLFDEEDVRCGSSRPARASNLNSGRASRRSKLLDDYFSLAATYREYFFMPRFCVSRTVYIRLYRAVESRYSFIHQKKDAIGMKGFHMYEKCTAALRLVTYYMSVAPVEEYLRLSISTALAFLNDFLEGLVKYFKESYLQLPNEL